MSKSIISLPLLIASAIGALVLAIGLADYFAGVELLPTALRSENDAMIMIVLGAVIMVITDLLIVRSVLKRSKTRR